MTVLHLPPTAVVYQQVAPMVYHTLGNNGLAEGVRLNVGNMFSKRSLSCHNVVWLDRSNGASVILFNV